MDPSYSIVFSFRTEKGPESFAHFSVGSDNDKAHEIYKMLKGTTDVNEIDPLYIDFRENIEGLPVNLKMMTCTLDDLAENCKIITKELFKWRAMEGS
jgi:hypothetical protein